MRTRIIPKMLNDEVEEYLTRNDIVIVPVGTVEMHGGFPLDSETVVSEAFALKMAEACDGDCKWKRNGSGQHSGRNSLSDRNCGKSFTPGI